MLTATDFSFTLIVYEWHFKFTLVTNQGLSDSLSSVDDTNVARVLFPNKSPDPDNKDQSALYHFNNQDSIPTSDFRGQHLTQEISPLWDDAKASERNFPDGSHLLGTDSHQELQEISENARGGIDGLLSTATELVMGLQMTAFELQQLSSDLRLGCTNLKKENQSITVDRKSSNSFENGQIGMDNILIEQKLDKMLFWNVITASILGILNILVVCFIIMRNMDACKFWS